jgi:hypothetical protein
VCEGGEVPEDIQAHGEGQCGDWPPPDVTSALLAQGPSLLPGLLEAAKERARQKGAEEAKIQSQLKGIGKCPMGYDWLKRPGGWTCAGGAHFVTDAELAAKFGATI